MANEMFGDLLAAARSKRGLSIEQVSDALRIRTSIIEALETCNFAHMPLKGYARNMVSSYARFLGLNSTEITEQFLRDYREYERQQNRMTGATVSPLMPRHDTQVSHKREAGERETISISHRHRGSRSYWESADPTALNRSIDSKSYRASNAKRTARQKEAAGRGASIRNKHYSKRRSRSPLASLTKHPVVFVIALVVLILIILLLWALLANSCSGSSEVLSVTGASSSTPATNVDSATVDTNAAGIQEQVDEDSRYGPFEIQVVVNEGESWLRINVDGQETINDVRGAPWEETYQITTSVKIESGVPSVVTVYRNGEAVAFDTTSGLGVIELEVEEKPIVPNAQQ